ncbi:hypothetical protein [Kitasatospora phosalacinea]|uniref:hypothetical protein n=1 Tax=Kitasatospora phosalacinea TaxID=2065 RepID=UPI00052480BC|nr:hypothetical protein [Kitasatospora phosalacinea]
MDPDLDLELSDLMETSVKDLCVPVAVIVAESERRGRRRQLVRRLRMAGTAAAVAAVALGGANLGLPLVEAGPRPATGIAPAGSPPAPAPSPPASPSPSDSPAVSASRTPSVPDASPSSSATAVSARPLPLEAAPPLGRPAPSGKLTEKGRLNFDVLNVLDDLEAMQPGIKANARQSWGPDAAGQLYLLYQGPGRSKGALQLSVRQADRLFPVGSVQLSELQSQFRCGKDSGTAGNHQEMCTYGFLPDGSWEMVEANDAMTPGVYGYHVAVWRPSGLVVEFTEYCGRIDNRGVVVKDNQSELPFDLTTWRAFAESPSWEYYQPVNVEAR